SKRLVFREEIAQGGMPANRRMTYHFTKPGRYVLNLGNAFAQGGSGASYLLRMAADEGSGSDEDSLAWAKRRLAEIGARCVAAPTAELSTKVQLVKETKSNGDPKKTQACEMPAVFEGVISRPGDVDYFPFKAKAGQKVVLELRTPRAAPPHFNPRL